MDADLMIRFRQLYVDIRDKLNFREQDTFQYLLDRATYSTYSPSLDLGRYASRYDIILVDGATINNVQYDENTYSFVRDTKIEHPSARWNGASSFLSETLVKYYRLTN